VKYPPMNFTRICILFLSAALALAGCKSKPEKQNEQDAAEKTRDTSAIPEFIAQFPEPSNDRFNSKVIDVSSFEALYKNLGSNRTIRLTNDITLPEEWADRSNVNLELHFGLIVRGLSNLKILGGGEKPSKIIQPNRLYKVMEMYKCENVVFENIEAGHEPEKGSCNASVLVFNECKDIFIRNSILYGSGYEGITSYKSTNLNCRGTTIKECSFQILSLSQSENVRFLECTFTDNGEPHGAGKIYLAGTDRLLFDKCTFSNNAAYTGEVTEDPFFKMEDCLDVYLNECTFSNNKARYLVLRAKDLHLVNVKFENNTWEKAEEKAI
jgi:hypothetical protein